MFLRMELVLEAKVSKMMLVILIDTLGEAANNIHILCSHQLPSFFMGLIPLGNSTSKAGTLLIKEAKNFPPF